VKSLGCDWRSGWLASDALEGFCLLIQVRPFGAILFDKNNSVLTRLSANTDPIIDSLTLENGASIYFFAHRVIIAEFFEDSTVTWVALINGAQTIERAIFAAQSLHSNSYRHYSFSPSELENGRGDDSSAKQSTRVVFAEKNFRDSDAAVSFSFSKVLAIGKRAVLRFGGCFLSSSLWGLPG